MDIACPQCAATYRVPESLVAGGKALRCAACGGQWVPQAAPAADASAPVQPPPEPPRPAEALRPEAAPPPLMPRRDPGQPAAARGPALPAAWAASVLAVALGVFVLLNFRNEIAAAWPPFARVVALLGG